ncbi:DNA-directed RNA polymerase subunit D [Candidatus Pacearchaeota archaeon]|jgi:DNA-directed RNA polymerase subunit D|nr:DNA-directed RNA polymerase subunit D [Candidatus Pacearchaeota archaeon]
MKLIEKKKNQITFTAELDESLANAIRRYLDQIPILAIDEVEISKNDSALYDETVAHRLGVVPLKMVKGMNEKAEEQLALVVKKEGFVYSEELKGKVSPVYGKIPITLLKKGQELEILATARLGKGNKHAKFSPGLMFYRNAMKLKIDKDCLKEVANICPKNILKSENGKVVIVDENKCDACEACVEFCKKKGKNSIELTSTSELMITVESFGQMDEEEMFKQSIEVLKEDLKEVAKKISK